MIPIDEQIAFIGQEQMKATHIQGVNPDYVAMFHQVRASLQRLKAIDAVQVPEEPDEVKTAREFADPDSVARACVTHIDTLRDLLRRESARASEWEAEADKQFQYAGRVLEQANAAEAKLAENEALRKDAERYRWLRDIADRDDEGHCYIAQDEWISEGEGDDNFDEGVTTNWLQKDEADAAIDAAIKEQSHD